MSDIGSWYRGVPKFTRYWLSGTVVLTLLGRFGIVSPMNMILMLPYLKKLQLWRLATCVFYYPLSPQNGFHFLVNLYFLYNYSLRLESGTYAGNPADYLFLLIFNWICCVLIGLMAELPILMDPMVLSVLYIWCQLNKDTIVNFWFGTRFKAIYLPWVFLAFNMILNGGGLVELIGIIVGHMYFFLKFKYPQEMGGPLLLNTPDILLKWFPSNNRGVHGFGPPPERPAPRMPNFRGHQWGRGNTLGAS